MTREQDQTEAKRQSDVRRMNAAGAAFQKKMLSEYLRALKRRGRGGGSKHLTRSSGSRKSRGATRGSGTWTERGKVPPLLMKIMAQRGWIATDKYITQQEKSRLLYSNLLGQSALEREEEFKLDARRAPRSNPNNLTIHMSFSRPEGQDLADQKWVELILLHLKKCGAEDCNVVISKHDRTGKPHAHALVSRVKPDGSLVSLSQQRYRWRGYLRDCERELNITVNDKSVDTEKTPTPTSERATNARRRAKRFGTKDGLIAPQVVHRALARSTTFEGFQRELESRGIELKKAEKNGRTTGVTMQLYGANEALAGSSIDRAFSVQRIEQALAENRLQQQRVMQAQRLTEQHRREELERAQRPQYERDL
jgi:hypothetical protein